MKRHVQQIRKKILPTLRRYDVTRAAVFGSFARGETTKRSDIDLLIEFKGEKSLLDLAGLKIALQELLKTKVDVLTYNSLHPLLKDRILSEQEVIL
jgi:predicted nucleotidyltransferase